MATPVQRKAARTVGAGVIVLIVILITLALTFKAQTGLPFAPTTEVKAAIPDLHSLRTNDDVRSNSKRIGRVKALDYGSDGMAVVTMEIEGRFPVYNDARAAIWDYSALATKFVELTPGTPPSGELGDKVLPASQGESSKDLKWVLDILDAPTRQSAMSAVREVGTGLTGRQDDLQSLLSTAPQLIGNLGTTTGALADRRTDLTGILTSARDLTRSLETQDERLTALIGQVDTTFRAITVDGAKPLDRALALAPKTLQTVRPALDRLNGPLIDTRVAMTDLKDGGEALGRATPDVRGILRDGRPVLDEVPDVADSANPALSDLTETSEELRPLLPRATETVDYLKVALHGLAPYGPAMGDWAVRSQSFVSQGPDNRSRFARVGVSLSPQAVTGGLFPTTGGVPAFPKSPPPPAAARAGKPSSVPGGLPTIPGILQGGN